jgi:hypothetical protein
LRRRRVEIAPRAGLKAIYTAWAQLVSEALVRRTRFDPLHQAAPEQQLHERLPDWLDALSDRETVDQGGEGGGVAPLVEELAGARAAPGAPGDGSVQGVRRDRRGEGGEGQAVPLGRNEESTERRRHPQERDRPRRHPEPGEKGRAGREGQVP